MLATLSFFYFINGASANGADGNPHNWDRRRRCDQTDYSPPCGICEGYGGIPTGDENDQITLTTCEPLGDATSVTPGPKPVWSETFTANEYKEILIGPKTDPFCFNSFPSNSSAGNLCYRADYGSQTFDARNARALRYDLTVESSLGDIGSMIIHQGVNMWIVNHMPWYAFGVHQCICTTVKQAGDATAAKMYPVQYNWTQQMYFMGRERLGVEYMGDGYTEVLDHWAFGPHHVWSVPSSGDIRRMWQPFNGLQVFPSGLSNTTIDNSLFAEIPPALCKKQGGAAFRIKCDDNGYPQESSVESKPTEHDERRARQPKPSSEYRGDSFEEMSNTLNGWLKASTAGKNTKMKPCEEFTAQELQTLQVMLYLAKDDALDQIYQAAEDNRRMRGALNDLFDEWQELNNLVESIDDSDLSEIQRDGHCHEAVMWYVHHLNADAKEVLNDAPEITIPLLSTMSHIERCTSDNGDVAEGKICDKYMEQVTCASCHSNVYPPGHAFLKRSS